MEEATAAAAREGTSSRPSAPMLESPDDGDLFDSQQRRTGRDDEDDEARGGKSGGAEYTAAEIADRFVDVIEGKAPIDSSVKGAVGKFGGILDWKERRQQVQEELDKVQGEAAEYQRRSQEAEAGKAEAVQELMGATGEIDDLWLSVKRAQIAEAQARKDSELAKLRLRKTEKGARERAAARAELDAVRDRHAAALAELRSVRAELGALSAERDAAAELAALREELDSARAAHDAAEERRMRVELAWQEDKSQWQTELELGEQEARRLRDELGAAGDLEAKVAAASDKLVSLRAELFARAVQGAGEEQQQKKTAVVGKTKEEVEEVKASLEKAKDEARILRVAAASLRADLEKEKAELAELRRKKEAAGFSASVPSLEEELSRVTAELAAAQAQGEESETTTAERLSDARREAERAKARARAAQEEVAGAREDARAAKAAVQTVEARLEAVTREILAAAAAAEAATASADALQQQQPEDGAVALAAEEYEELSRRARETEEAAGKRVGEAARQIKEAKDAEARSLESLAQLARQGEQRRQALLAATAEAEEAESGKAAAERELRRWQQQAGDHRRSGTASPRTGLAEISTFDDRGGTNPHILSPRGGYMPRSADMTPAALAAAEDADARQKKNFFPRMVMFLARKRQQTWNGK